MTTLAHADPSLILLSSSFADAKDRKPFLVAPAREGVRFIHGALVGLTLCLPFWILVVWAFLR